MPPILDPRADFEDDGGTPGWRARHAPPTITDEARHKKRIRIAKEIAGGWIWAWVLYVLGLIPFGGSAEYAACGFLALLVTMPIFVAAAIYASEPSKVRRTGGYGGWHYFRRL